MIFEVDGHEVFAAGALPGDGRAPPVVLIHGAALDHTSWALFTRYFMHVGRGVAAIDLPGHGRSRGAALSSIEEMARWLARGLDACGIETVALAGHSLGALVALELAAALGSRVYRLALLGAAVPMTVSEALLSAAGADEPRAREMMMLWAHGFAARVGGNPVAGVHIVNSTLRVMERARPGVLHSDLSACNTYTAGLAAGARVRAATTLVCGTDDRMTPSDAVGELAAVIPHCSVELLPRCGHIMMSEQPEHTHQKLIAALD